VSAEPSTTSPPPPPALNDAQRTKLTSPLVLWPAALVLAVLFFFALDYLNIAFTHESTDDAFIAGHIVSIAPRISGQVAAVHVLDNQMVRSNDVLVELDPADYATTLAQKNAAQSAQDSNYKAAVAGYGLMGVKVTTAEATARESQADADASTATAARAAADFERAKALRQQGTTSAQEYDQAQATAEEAKANLNSAQQKAASDQSKIEEAKAQLTAAKAEANAVLAQVSQSKTDVDSAQLNLSYAKILAPCDGRVTRKQVEAGDYIQTGQTLFSIVPTEVWVMANFKESQLEKMSPGQAVRVEIEALGGRKFRAHVDSVQAGSGAAFSLLPPENATGNFVKVVQRVPVKILFDEPLPADKTLGPGLSVVARVRTVGYSAPDWAMALVAVILAFALAVGFRFVLNRKLHPAA
jgi:membrane fusion protein (multidrug efflux system)